MIVAIYVRSSKDASDGLSVAAQERAMREWAKERGATVAGVFKDTELSGTLDEASRPGLAALLDSAKQRLFREVLVLDSSRIARDPVLLGVVESRLQRCGVALLFKSLPLENNAMGELMRTISAAVDRLHSRLSREKSIAAMAELTRQGFRAGGRAPYGYQRELVPTGAIRDGTPVMRSRLALDPVAAPIVADYLKRRAAGESRVVAKERSGIPLGTPSLVSLERNAMVYAGFVVWGVRSFSKPTREDPVKRTTINPTSAHVLADRPAHPALVTLEEAQRIAALPASRTRTVDARRDSLLGGLLQTPDGRCFQLADGGQAYRAPGKGRRIAVSTVDTAVMATVARDARSKSFIADVINAARATAAGFGTDGDALRDQLGQAQARIDRVVDAIAEGTSSDSLRAKLRALEADKARLEADLAAEAGRAQIRAALSRLEPRHVSAWFDFALGSLPKDAVRDQLRTVVDRIVVDPEDPGERLEIRYRLAPGRDMASPRGFEPRSQP
jgi:site-specific DNA recombinase